MNTINFELTYATRKFPVVIDGFEFTNSTIIDAFIDGISIRKIEGLKDSLIVLSELKRSLTDSGKHLIFTSVIGIADDGGWDGVEIAHKDKTVLWSFETEYHYINWTFDFERYYLEIQKIIDINPLNLEPSQVVFPESWDND